MTNQRLCVGSLCWYLITARDMGWLLLVLSMLIPTVSLAQRVPTGYHRIASQYQIPATVLYAVALTESGKAIDQRIYRPWPWTLNVAGQPKRFKSHSAACLEIKHQLTNGVRSIDIGLMQINWRWNKQRLHNPCQALFPYTNLHHGAALLKAAYSVKHSWPAAVGHYHSPGQKQAQRNRAEAHIQRYQRHFASLSTF